MNDHDDIDDFPLACHRCGKELKSGDGSFYVVRIEAMADPSPPRFSEEDLSGDAKAEIERLLAKMSDLSEQEALDQVYRRLVLYLCCQCYRGWIENPVQ